MTLIARIENISKAWQVTLPHIAPPPPTSISQWCNYSDAAIEKGLVRASKKFAADKNTGVDAETIYRYICGVARNEALGNYAH